MAAPTSALGRGHASDSFAQGRILMVSCPTTIDRATVLVSSPIDGRHRATGNRTHSVRGVAQPLISGVAVCQYKDDQGFHLFYCDQAWRTITKTRYATLKEAMDQAEIEFEGVSATWLHAGTAPPSEQ